LRQSDRLSQRHGRERNHNLNELFLKAVAKYGKPDCFLFKSEGRYQGVSSQEALRKVAALASLLSRLHIESGDRVAILSENRVNGH